MLLKTLIVAAIIILLTIPLLKHSTKLQDIACIVEAMLFLGMLFLMKKNERNK